MTFSIVARDPASDAVGVAVHSKFISIGAVTPWADADAGAVATQSFINVDYGPDGLELLDRGLAAEDVVDALTTADDAARRRQVGVIGLDGEPAAFTGADCVEVAGSIQGPDYSVQGNMLANAETLEAMATAFESTTEGFPERLLASLQAGNEAGGDKRGEQAAALYIAKPGGGYEGQNDQWVDIRVDDHETPIDELRRVFRRYDVTMLARGTPETFRRLSGATAAQVTTALSAAGYDVEAATESFGPDERRALETFQGVNNFENHSLDLLEHALADGWDDASGEGERRLLDAVWHGLSKLERT